MKTDDEIDKLACGLIGRHGNYVEQIIKDTICIATDERRWDEVLKWNRVRWRVQLLRRARQPRPAANDFGRLSVAP